MIEQPIDELDAIVIAGRRLDRVLTKALKGIKAPVPLKSSAYWVLEYIAQHPRCARNDIVEAAGASRAKFTEVIQHLITDGLVIEEPSEISDVRKKTRLSLDDSAVDLVAQARDLRDALLTRLTDKGGAEAVLRANQFALTILATLPIKRSRGLAAPRTPSD